MTPLRVYQHHEAELRACQSSEKARDLTLQYIASDPQARLVIYFHGNAGTVGQTRRTEAYRSISSGDCDNLYVLAFDYRGFGRSTGAPTEEGLTTDALAVIEWAATVAKVRHQHIFLVAQSLGTAVAASAVYRLGTSIELGGMVMCAPFTDAAAVILGYKGTGYTATPRTGPIHPVSTHDIHSKIPGSLEHGRAAPINHRSVKVAALDHNPSSERRGDSTRRGA